MTSQPGADVRVDPHLGTVVHVVGTRQARPNLPSSGCPFCPGGLEAPDPYDVRWFTNRWPAMPDERCEVVLYTPEHDATFASLGVLALLLYPFDDRFASNLLPLTAIPYFLLYGRDLVRLGYSWADLPRVYALNLLLLPVILAGVVTAALDFLR